MSNCLAAQKLKTLGTALSLHKHNKNRYCCNSYRWNNINFTNAENLNVATLTENLGNIGKQCNKNGVCDIVISAI